MIPKHFKTIIQKYEKGFVPEKHQGRHVKANTEPDYDKFVDYWLKRKREGTIRQYLKILHQWSLPITEQNLRDFDGSIEYLNELRYDYEMYNSGRKNWIPSIQKKDQDMKINNLARFSYLMHRVIRMYLISTRQDNLLSCLPDIKRIQKPKHYVKTGHLTKEEFEKFINQPDNLIKLFFEISYITGSRVSELLHAQKHKDWIPSYQKKEVIKLKPGELFKISIPRSFAKAKEQQELYINDKLLIQKFVKHINSLKDNEYLFKFNDDIKGLKSYLDIEKEKYKIYCAIEHFLGHNGLSHRIGDITIHSFRRSFIHNIYDDYDKDIEFTSKVARHTSGINMTGTYLKSRNEDVEKRLKEKMAN